MNPFENKTSQELQEEFIMLEQEYARLFSANKKKRLSEIWERMKSIRNELDRRVEEV